MNMFTENVKPRRGRPAGESAKGAAARQRLYDSAITLIAAHGYEAATMRDVARRAGVSPGLLYRYFPSKRAVVVALYDELSAQFERDVKLPQGRWRTRFIVAVNASLAVLRPHRTALQALIPVLVSAGQDGLFAAGTSFSRIRVQQVFERAVVEASDAPPAPFASPLGRMLFIVHVLVLLWWLLDRTLDAKATDALVRLMDQMLPSVTLTLRLPSVRRFVMGIDRLVGRALFENAGS